MAVLLILEVMNTIGESGNWPLNGLLTIPQTATATNPVPAAIIVQGSGSANMDGYMFGNRPYYDIATYLSANGIAVIRNDKRGYAHADALLTLAQQDVMAFGGLTVWDEAIEDALLAAELLLADPRIDSNRIYLVGHSLGAILAPRIQIAAQENGFSFAGLILMAGTSRELTQTVLDQTYASIAEAPTPEAQEMLDVLTTLAPMIWETPSDEAKAMFWFGASFFYIQDLANPTFGAAVSSINIPILVMQGARDFQIRADVDFIQMQEILSGRGNVAFKLYDDLDHLFMPSAATTFVEHATLIMESPRRVDAQVLQDIADWILSNK